MSRHTSAEQILARVERHIRLHHKQDLTLTNVAAMVPVSPFYLAHLFRRERCTTFLKYLTKVRLEEARTMLVDSDLPVSMVSAQVGYRSVKRFRVLFKRAFDLTPTAYRTEKARHWIR
jgi:two-component system response regulator YesN